MYYGLLQRFCLIVCFQAPSSEPVSKPEGRQRVTLIPGDGVGPEVMASVKDVISAAGAPVDFDELFIRYNCTVLLLLHK